MDESPRPFDRMLPSMCARPRPVAREAAGAGAGADGAGDREHGAGVDDDGPERDPGTDGRPKNINT